MTKRLDGAKNICIFTLIMMTLLFAASALIGYAGIVGKVNAAAVTVNETVEIGSGTSKSISSEFVRAANLQGDMYVVRDGGTLTLKSGAVLDGNRDGIVFQKNNAAKFVDGALVKVESGGTLIIEEGAVLTSNADTAIKAYGSVQMKGGTITNCGSLWGYDVSAIPAASSFEYTFVDNVHGEWGFDEYSSYYSTKDDYDSSTNSLLEFLNGKLLAWSNALNKAQAGSLSGAAAKDIVDAARAEILKAVNSSSSVGAVWYSAFYGSNKQDPFMGCSDCYAAINNNFGTISVDGVDLYTIPDSTHIHKESLGSSGVTYEYGEDSYTQKGGAIYAGAGSSVTIDGGYLGGDGESTTEVFYAVPNVQTGEKTFVNANLATDGGAIYIEGASSVLTVNGGKMAFNDVANRFTHIPEYTPTTEDSVKYTPVVAEEHGLGGAIFAGGGSTVNLNGGGIGDYDAVADLYKINRANGGAGINVAADATVNITDGNIRHNKTMFGMGGGVRVDGGTLNMSGGNVTLNTAFWGVIGCKDNQNSGAGVAVVAANSTFNLSGGSITGNVSVHNGAGVYLGSTSSGSMTFNMTGGLIQNNKAVGIAGCEVYIADGNKKIAFSGGNVIHTLSSSYLDESALYVVNNSSYAANPDNYIKLDGTVFTGVFYLTRNTQYFTATAKGEASVYKLAVSDDFVASPYKKVIEIEGNDATLRDKIMELAQVVTPSKSLTTDAADNHIYILGYINGNGTHFIDGYTTPQVTYGTELPVPVVKLSGGTTPVGTAEYKYYKLDEVTGEYIQTDFTTVNRPKNVGKYKIEAVITDGMQQTAVNYAFEIVKLAITINVDSYSVILGHSFTAPDDKVTISALSYDDIIEVKYSAAAAGKPYTNLATKHFTVGNTYSLKIDATHTNYDITYSGARQVTITENAAYTRFITDYADILAKLPDGLTFAEAKEVRDALGKIYDLDDETKGLLADETDIFEIKLDEMSKYLAAYDALEALKPFIPDGVIEANSSIIQSMLDVAKTAVNDFVYDGGKISDLSNYGNIAATQAALDVNAFRVKHKEILAADIADIDKDDLDEIKTALADYKKLSDGAKAILTAEKADLDIKYNKALLDKTLFDALAAIDRKTEDMRNSGKYSDVGLAQIDNLITEGKAALNAQTTANDVSKKLQEYMDKLNAVKISSTGPVAPPSDNGGITTDDEADYGKDHDFKGDGYFGSVGNSEGMDSDVVLVIKDKDKTDKIEQAIKANKDIKKTALKGVIDVNLMKDGAVYVGSGVFNVKVLLPENLRGDETVQLAKVNADGSVTVIESRLDGKYLYFSTGDFGNFVLVAKDNVNLWWLIIILLIIILAQIAFIIFLLYKRKSDGGVDGQNNGGRANTKDDTTKGRANTKDGTNRGKAKVMSSSPAILFFAAFIPSSAITIIIIQVVAIIGLGAYTAYLLLRRNKTVAEVADSPVIAPVQAAADSAEEETAAARVEQPFKTEALKQAEEPVTKTAEADAVVKEKTTKPRTPKASNADKGTDGKTEVVKPRKPRTPMTEEQKAAARAARAARPPVKKMEKVSHAEVNKFMTDDDAKSHLDEREFKVDKSHKEIVNLDILSGNFNDGDVVTLNEIKRKGLVGKKTTYFKVLARGVINKAITVEANEFSIDAVKMLTLTGGKAIKLIESKAKH